ncbi:helix-turn-helix domain-containing protein [Enterococcus sp. N249-2]
MRDLQMKFIGSHSNARWFQILNLVEDERFFTIKSLAERTGVSQRTIIKDINYLKDFFKESVSFVSGVNGYRFEEIDLIHYKKQKRKLIQSELLFEIVGNIFYDEKETIEEVAEYYNSSESTVRRLLLQIQPTLETYGLKLNLYPIDIVGPEEALRKFFKDFYYIGEQTPHTLFPPEHLHKLINQLIPYVESHEVRTGMTPAAFYYSFFIATERFKNGHTVTVPSKLKEILYKDENFLLLYDIYEKIEPDIESLLPMEEFSWIYLVTIGKRTIDCADQEKNFCEKFPLWPAISDVTVAYIRERAISVSNQIDIEAYIHSFFLSKKINNMFSPAENKVMNEVTRAVKKNYACSFEANFRFLIAHQDILTFSQCFLEDICVSLTMYIEMLLEFHQQPKKILFLLEGDHLICQSTRIAAQYLLGYQNNIVFLPLSKLTEKNIEDAQLDLVVTNYAQFITDFNIEAECILVNSIMNKKDWERVIEKVNPSMKKILF